MLLFELGTGFSTVMVYSFVVTLSWAVTVKVKTSDAPGSGAAKGVGV